MNYLAHSFLSFTDGQIVGQFLEDFIRNRDRFSFPKDIQDGITLHRAIDTYTDSHPAIHEAKKVFESFFTELKQELKQLSKTRDGFHQQKHKI
mgnify:CR=1 FL=1